MRQLLSAVATLGLLAACVAPAQLDRPSGATAADLGSSLAQLTMADLKNASADAKAHGDTLASMCYDFLAGQVTAQAGTSGSAITGAVSAFQRLRDLKAAADAGISRDFQINCAPLLSDTQLNLLKLGALGAGIAGSGGTLP